MVTFKLEINLDNDAFQGGIGEVDNDELAAVIHRVADSMQDYGTHSGLEGRVRDYNGNTVGKWSIREES